MKNYFKIFLFAILVEFPIDSQEIPNLIRPVMDMVGILKESEIRSIEKKIFELEKEKGSQIGVLIVSSTKPETIEEYSIKVAEKWKLGRKGIDDGVLFVIALNDRKMRIEVGYGLEGAIPDAKAKQILEDYVKPHFKEKKYYDGISICVDMLIKLIRGEALPPPKKDSNSEVLNSIIAFFIIFVFHFFAWIILGNIEKLKTLIMIGIDIFLIFLFMYFFQADFITSFILVGILLWIAAILISNITGTTSSYSGSSYTSSSRSWSSSSWKSSSGGFSGRGGSFGGGGASSSW